MKKLFMMLEDLWVAAAFAEEDAHDELMINHDPQLPYGKFALLRNVRSR